MHVDPPSISRCPQRTARLRLQGRSLLALAILMLTISLFPTTSSADPSESEKPPRMSSGHEHPVDSTGHVHPDAVPTEVVGITERLGDSIPLDLTFTDEDGNPVKLRDLITGPTIIAPVYYHCPNVCSFLQADLARSLPQVKLRPGTDYRVLSVSFDERETPAAARAARKTYLAAMGQPFPPDAWHFLTGDIEAIRSLTDAAGYGFLRQGDDFLHPVVIFVVSREGRIVRYLYGTRLLPMDLTLALTEAGEGRVGTTIRKMVSFCFSFDPEKKRYMFNYLRLSATVVLLTAGGFLAFLIATGRKK